jgi:hypothetical protein
MAYTKNAPATNRVNLELKKFHDFTVIEVSHKQGKILFWKCLCKCGNYFVARSQSIRNGLTKNCGCKIYRKPADNQRKRAYVIWSGMMARCYDKRSPSYKNYGAKEKLVSDDWHSFDKFYLDMGYPPNGLTLERIDNNLGYSKTNCIWADRKTQARNRFLVRHINAHGKTMTMQEWADLTGLKYATIYKRIVTLKWDYEKAIPKNLIPNLTPAS